MGVEHREPVRWRNNNEMLTLTGSNCQHCEVLHFPPRAVCPDCGGHASKNPVKKVNPDPSSVVESQSGQADIET